MDERLELHELLCEVVNITEPDGDRHVYFQPPPSVKIKYPAIVYSRDRIDNTFANNSVYMQHTGYKITLIDRNPDSIYVKKISKLPRCRFDRHYTANNMNHDVFIKY